MEESAELIQSTLAVIHRFMSAHTSLQDNMQGSVVNINIQHDNLQTAAGSTTGLRHRTVSENDHNPNALSVVSIQFHLIVAGNPSSIHLLSIHSRQTNIESDSIDR